MEILEQLRWPVRVYGDDGSPLAGRGGSRVTQEYRPGNHLGVDISVGERGSPLRRSVDADVLAVADGIVTIAGESPRGYQVLIRHGYGASQWTSAYLHLRTLSVSVGQSVSAGQILGQMGVDPLDSQRVVHLHLQFARMGATFDPAGPLTMAMSG